jgi:hypothetical protein
MARLSGELYEYMRVSSERQLGGRVNNFELSLIKSRNPQVWLEGLKLYTRRWIEQHRDGFRDRSASVRPQRVQEQVVGSQS